MKHAKWPSPHKDKDVSAQFYRKVHEIGAGRDYWSVPFNGAFLIKANLNLVIARERYRPHVTTEA
jgi:hypothetical protein